jgi:hypothetical protein
MIALVATGFALGACAIRPLPEHVTGVNTATIVKKTRCEARAAIVASRVDWLHDHGHPQVINEDTLIEYEPTFDQKTIKFLTYFDGTGIVYNFTLDGTESNGASFTADVVRPLMHTTTTLTPSAGDTLMREDIRSFTISDSFGELLGRKMRGECDKLGVPGPNYQYPIVGRIGVEEIVTTFIELTFNGLGVTQDLTKNPPKIGDTPSSSSPIAMVDTINFTTTITAGLTAKVVFSPPGMDWRLADATLPLTASRTDKHQLIIGLALPGPPSSVVATQVVGPGGAVRSMFLTANTPRLITARQPTANTGEAVALDAVNAQILRFEVPKSLIVTP